MTVNQYCFDLGKRLGLLFFVAMPSILLLLFMTHTYVNIALATWFIIISIYFIGLFVGNHLTRLFNKLTPWNEPESISQINKNISAYSLHILSIDVFDQSKRSLQGNAYIAGIGQSKKIFLADTLLKKMNPQEIIAIIYHELGHHYYRHILKFTILFMLGSLFYCLLFYTYTNMPASFNIFILFAPIFYFYCLPIKNFFSRHFEFQADHFAEICQSSDALKQVLSNLAEMNQSPKTGDKLYIAWFYSHPPISERIYKLK